MGAISVWHWIIVAIIVLVLFGGGKLSRIMGDFGKGLKEFKKNVKDDNDKNKKIKKD
ncbi:twin-arginine translocase TatA/TatE family subunit [Alphaproteobacteria bacterium]|nr:twin-arginine translocase TatA/TatE family subunit [Alphaproteobacteria bacterium]